MPIKDTKRWFNMAIPKPSTANLCVQLGCHLEEICEMFPEITGVDNDAQEALLAGFESMLTLANDLKTGAVHVHITPDQRVGMLDALADQIVTAVGVAHMLGMDIVGALNEVNRSNFSKFVDGKPVFNDGGKIAKSEKYSPPDLTVFASARHPDACHTDGHPGTPEDQDRYASEQDLAPYCGTNNLQKPCAPDFTYETNGLPNSTARPISDQEWAALPANLREGCTTHCDGVGDL